MITNLNINNFIKEYITGRKQSLLAADFLKYKKELHKRIDRQNVLVIGGAGTIGSYYIKALLHFKIKKLIVVDINENGLTELVRDLRSSLGYNIPAEFVTYPISFADEVFKKIFKTAGPFDIVANFAAHKHVRSEKDVYSIEAMVYNNVIRAQKLLDLLSKNPPRHFFCVSTDKAANPVNIMGASKKLMEELIMAYSSLIPITTARFANVAFSNGSLLFGFLERLKNHQPWACPNNIKRFFVSPEESGELCLMASVLGESGDIFFPKLDEHSDMIEFSKIALDLLKALNLKPDICQTEEEARQKALKLGPAPASYPIYFFASDTSGEKPYEEFYTDNEDRDLISFINLGVVKKTPKRNLTEINEIIRGLTALFVSDNLSKADIVNFLKHYLPNFSHIETGKNLDQKM
jgi:FlaA1/EpsC-like NDP-sugar epimerase